MARIYCGDTRELPAKPHARRSTVSRQNPLPVDPRGQKRLSLAVFGHCCVAIRAMARGVPVTAAMLTKFASFTPDEHIDTAVETSLQTSQGEFPVVDGMGRPVGLLARNDSFAR
jgi:hypothetical protein